MKRFGVNYKINMTLFFDLSIKDYCWNLRILPLPETAIVILVVRVPSTNGPPRRDAYSLRFGLTDNCEWGQWEYRTRLEQKTIHKPQCASSRYTRDTQTTQQHRRCRLDESLSWCWYRTISRKKSKCRYPTVFSLSVITVTDGNHPGTRLSDYTLNGDCRRSTQGTQLFPRLSSWWKTPCTGRKHSFS